MSFYKLYRPEILEDVCGNEGIKQKIQEYLDDPDSMPHTIMFTGQSGCGKTTFGRIIAHGLGAELQEYNCADVRSLDEFRDIIKTFSQRAFGNKMRVAILDEVHRLPNATQELLLKPLEDGTSSTIIILCTTNPEKLLKTVKTRPIAFECESLSSNDMLKVLARVCKAEKIKIKKSAIEAIIKAADGSSRQALTILESVAGLPLELMLKRIKAYTETPEEIITLCRAIMSGKSFKTVVEIAKKIEGEPETIRRTVLGYACACMPNMGEKAYNIANAFRDNWFDTGKQGLMLALWEACNP